MEAVWAFLEDPANRDVLTWVGGGLVVVIGGLWAVLTFFVGRKPSVSASGDGSIAGGRDVNVSQGAKAPSKGKSKR